MGQPSARTTQPQTAPMRGTWASVRVIAGGTAATCFASARLQVHDPVLAGRPGAGVARVGAANASSFAGDSSRRPGLCDPAIIIDQHRERRGRSTCPVSLRTTSARRVPGRPVRCAWRLASGCAPAALADPGRSAEQPTLPCCVLRHHSRTPEQARRVFAGGAGPEVREIAEQRGISTNNCHVVLHRARKRSAARGARGSLEGRRATIVHDGARWLPAPERDELSDRVAVPQ